MRVSAASRPKVLVLVTSLCAEGTPVLALGMCRRWLGWGIEPTVLTLADDPADLKPEFESAGVPIVGLRARTSGYGRYLPVARRIHSIARQFRPAAILSFPLGWHVPAAIAGRVAGVSAVAAHVGNYPPFWAGKDFWRFRIQMDWGRWAGTRLVCCSNYVRDGVVEHFRYPRELTDTVYNGCDVAEISRRAGEARRARAGKYDKLRVGMVARLELHKDQPTLIRAVATLRTRGLDVCASLVGDGSRRGEYERMVADLGLDQSVRLLGTRRDIPELLGGWDIFAFAAKRDEGFGIALAEAMAAGTPIVATGVGACQEVLAAGNFGLLVPPADHEALADGIQAVASAPEDASARARAAREHAERSFTLDRMASGYARILGLS